MPDRLWVEPVPVDLAFNSPEANLARVEAEIAARLKPRPAKPGAPSNHERLFLFPELTLTGFVTKDPPCWRLGEGPVAALARLARDYRVGLAAGFPERNPARPGKPFNALALFGPDGRLVARYRKVHLFTLGAAPESKAYSAGNSGVVARFRGWRVGLAVCFDLRFARLFHAYARAGADLALVGSCWVAGPHKSEQFRTLAAAHAVLGQCYVASVNRAGRDPAFEYDGSAYVFSPFGESLYDGGPVAVDPERLAAARSLSVRSADRANYGVRTSVSGSRPSRTGAPRGGGTSPGRTGR